MALHAVMLPAVYDISSVVNYQVMSIGTIFVSVPVVVIVVVVVVDSDLDLLSFGFDYKHGWRSYGSSQKE